MTKYGQNYIQMYQKGTILNKKTYLGSVENFWKFEVKFATWPYMSIITVLDP